MSSSSNCIKSFFITCLDAGWLRAPAQSILKVHWGVHLDAWVPFPVAPQAILDGLGWWQPLLAQGLGALPPMCTPPRSGFPRGGGAHKKGGMVWVQELVLAFTTPPASGSKTNKASQKDWELSSLGSLGNCAAWPPTRCMKVHHNSSTRRRTPFKAF